MIDLGSITRQIDWLRERYGEPIIRLEVAPDVFQAVTGRVPVLYSEGTLLGKADGIPVRISDSLGSGEWATVYRLQKS